MDKETFLRTQYLRMLNSEQFVAEQWRSSIDRFLADLWDRTPSTPGKRFLEPIDPDFGYSPDNVEWQFKKIAKKAVAVRVSQKTSKAPERESLSRLTKTERKANEQAAKEEQRKAIAVELAEWNEGQLAVRLA